MLTSGFWITRTSSGIEFQQMSEGRLDQAIFATVVANAPLVSIDLIVIDDCGRVLLGYRRNRPAKDYWFVPGGRIYKNERLADAFSRIASDELGQSFSMHQAQFIGPFEHHYPDSALDEAIATHYVVLGFCVRLTNPLNNLPKTQHGGYRWLSVDELILDEQVHLHVKWYFQNNLIMRHA